MKISIAIPTRERADLLRAALASVIAIDDPGLEIVVSDNASGDGTDAVVRSFPDPRLRYVNTGRRVSQRQNFEHALRTATGDYVMLIGDDDAVLARQWPYLRAILARERPSALSWPALFYQWPAPEKRAGGGMLRLRRGLVYGAAEERQTADQLRALCRLERTREDRSPKLYHGLLSRAVVDRLAARTGDVVMSGQVDAYIAAAALAVMDSYHYVRHPFTILAMGPRSGGSSVLTQFAAGGNDTLDRVEREAADDPVREVMAGPFPSLGFYYLNGIEQARRHVFGGVLPLDHEAHYAMILDQLAIVPAEARARGVDLLHKLAAENGALAAFESALATAPPARKPTPSPESAPGFVRRIESLSHLTVSRVVIDLKARPGEGGAPGAVDHAARVADRLIGDFLPDGSGKDWWSWGALLARATREILGIRSD